MTFTRKISNIYFPYKLNAIDLKRVDRVRDLGIIYDSRLTFSQHVDFVVNKSSKMLGFIIRTCRNFQNLKVMITLFNAYVRSVLEYNSIVFNPMFKKDSDRIEKIQKRFLKYLVYRQTGIYPKNLSYEHLIDQFNFSTLSYNRTNSGLKYLSKVLNNKVDDPEFLSNIKFNTEMRKTRLKNLFYLSTPRTNTCINSPVYRILHSYNSGTHNFDFFC